MAKLILLSGLPASGKSTKAAEIIKKDGNVVRVNRDLLRTMLHFDKWTGKNEGLTVQAEKSLVYGFLNTGMNVIVDDTNLNEKVIEMWRTIAANCDAKIQYITIDTPWQECIVRDIMREKSVGKHVIMQMAMAAGLVAPPRNGYVICDLDGTLCDIDHRLHFVGKCLDEDCLVDGCINKSHDGKKDWKAFFAGIKDDTVRTDVRDKLLSYAQDGMPIVFVSARPDSYRAATEAWLDEHYPYPYFTLIMRRAGDHRVDHEVKKEILDRYFPKDSVSVVIDDRPSVIRMWRDQGLFVIDVGKGVEF